MNEALETAAADGAPAEPGEDLVKPSFRLAARLTAQTLLLENDGLTALNPDHQSEVNREQELGVQELAEGDSSALADQEESAIQHYRQAWLHAATARLHATRPRHGSETPIPTTEGGATEHSEYLAPVSEPEAFPLASS